MNPSYIPCFCVVGVLILIGAVSAARNDQAIEKLYLEVYGSGPDSVQLSPEQTQEHLQEMSRLMAEQIEASTRSETINNLLLVSDVNVTYCEDLKRLKKNLGIANSNIFNQLNLVPYLNFYLKQQFQLCKETIERQFEAGKAAMSRRSSDKLRSFAKRLQLRYLVNFEPEDMKAEVIGFIESERRNANPLARFFPKNMEIGELKKCFESDIQDVYEEAADAYREVAYVALADIELTGNLDRKVVELMKKLLVVKKIVDFKPILMSKFF